MAKTSSFLPYNPKLKAIARRLRNNMTPAEIILWQHLKGKQMDGYDFDRQKPIDAYIVDFYCKRLKLAIEVDGSSHNCEASQIQDRYRQSRLESLGISFLRFQNGEVQHETEAVLSTIRAWISSHSVR
ncbi:MAG: endonuclease domain-containing protein [Leptolyngbya sp. SIOISBB]|nr:endonuclease domain-containing protein [Leptolyngbya sp. SIOISBB]